MGSGWENTRRSYADCSPVVGAACWFGLKRSLEETDLPQVQGPAASSGSRTRRRPLLVFLTALPLPRQPVYSSGLPMKIAAPSLPNAPAGRHRIGAVVEQTGLSQHAIRVWERRYGAVIPERSGGGSRLYSDLDIERLQLLQRLTRQGHAISALAKLPTAQLQQLAGMPGTREPKPEPSEPGGWAAPFLNAAKAFDASGMERALTRAAGQMSPRELVLRVIAPLATEIGVQWQRGELTIAQEHAATAALRDLLTRLRRNYDADSDGPIALAATLAGEKHELGLLMAVLLAAMAGWKTVYLGTEVPAEQIVAAVRTAEARLLLLSLVAQHEFETRGVLRELRDNLPTDVEILVGGRAAVAASGVRRVESLSEFEKELELVRRGTT